MSSHIRRLRFQHHSPDSKGPITYLLSLVGLEQTEKHTQDSNEESEGQSYCYWRLTDNNIGPVIKKKVTGTKWNHFSKPRRDLRPNLTVVSAPSQKWDFKSVWKILVNTSQVMCLTRPPAFSEKRR